MSIINTLLLSARYELKDIDGSVYSDYVIMDAYNKGNKILRQIILKSLPMQLAEEVNGNVDAGESITMPKKPIKFIDFRVNKNKIDKISLSEIRDTTTTGEPRYYYLLNTSTVKLYPIPDNPYPYVITYIPESIDMADTADSGYQTDVERLLVRYIVATLTGQSFDMAGEYAAIASMLSGVETGVTVINGYYAIFEGGRDYR